MKYKCTKCMTVNTVPENSDISKFACNSCKAPLPSTPIVEGDTSAAVGMVGGAALGAALGGPIGAIIGGVVGGLLGKEAKGVG